MFLDGCAFSKDLYTVLVHRLIILALLSLEDEAFVYTFVFRYIYFIFVYSWILVVVSTGQTWVWFI